MAALAHGDPRDVSERVVVITGAGQGIGRQYALSFAAAGAIPVIAEIDGQAARRVEREIAERGGRALAIEVDVADPQSCTRMAQQVTAAHGRIDVLINNAAIFSSLRKSPFEEIALAEWDKVMQVNVTGPFLCARAVVPAMRAAGWGRIINVTSSSVTMGTPSYLHYVTSKSALLGMTNALARELGQTGITVNCIMPSSTTTEIERQGHTPQSAAATAARQCIPRPQVPQDIVGLALFLASPASDFITGQTIAVNGGLNHR